MAPAPLNGRRPLIWALAPYLIRDGKLVGESYDKGDGYVFRRIA